MKNKHSSIDGFIPRRSGDRMGSRHDEDAKKPSKVKLENKKIHNSGEEVDRMLGQQSGRGLGRTDIDDSLKDIDDDIKPQPKKLSRRQRRKLAKQSKKPQGKIRKLFKWLFRLIILVAIMAAGYTGYKLIGASGNMMKGSIFDIFKSQPLAQDSNGRSNFLILGTSEDDAGHDGASLTDSMLVVSVDQNNKNIYMFSVPRDLYVEYGQACPSGYSGKINAYFSCVNNGATSDEEQTRLTKTQKLIGDIFGLDIQYGMHVNHTVIKEAVNAIGGVDVDVQGSNGAPGILDRNFDWRCNYKCYLVKYENGVHHLDGEHALFLSMARGDVAPTYGLGNSNFDREKNQQKIMIAIRDKAMSIGTLTDIGAITKLIDALGNNLRTNVQTSEIRTIMQVASDAKPADIHTISLVDEGVVDTGNIGGASVVKPSAGTYSYDDIRALIKKNLNNDPIAKESAPIVVLNGTGQTGYGQTKADDLKAKGYNVVSVGNAPDGKFGAVDIYQIGTDSPETAKKLSSLYNVTLKTTPPPTTVNGDDRFVIIFGSVSN